MRKRFIITLLSLICAFGCIFPAACASGGANENPKGEVTAPVENEDEIKKLQQQIADLQKEIQELSDRLNKLELKNSCGQFYTLQDAYDKGFLTQADLMSIAYYHHSQLSYPHNGTAFNVELMGEDYQPIEKFPKDLSKEFENAIKQTLINNLRNENFSESLELNNISISSYYGTYNGGVAIRLFYSKDEYGNVNDVIRKDTVEDVAFYYSDYTEFFHTVNYNFNNKIMFWKI